MLTPNEISAEVLKYLKKTAERRLNIFSNVCAPITSAVITVPAYFSQIQKLGTLEAAKLAGFTTTELITEPAAGMFSYNNFTYERSQDFRNEALIEIFSFVWEAIFSSAKYLLFCSNVEKNIRKECL